MANIRMAQYGTKHGHATGKLVSMQTNPNVEVVGVYEPDDARRQELANGDGPFQNVHWFENEDEMLRDESIVAIASEGANIESLSQTEAIVQAGKHVWYDKPAGEDWAQWQRVVALAKERELLIQMGYMFRYHDGFNSIAEWVHSGFLGNIFSVRAHMSTNVAAEQMGKIGVHQGGIFFDLGGHMLDQIVYLLGRPHTITSFLRQDRAGTPACVDNTLTVYEYENAFAMIDIAALETKPMARRFEVYGTKGSAMLIEPFEPGSNIRLCLDEKRGDFAAGDQLVPIDVRSRQELYDRALVSFLAIIQGQKAPDRTPEHDLLVQETLLRATGKIQE